MVSRMFSPLFLVFYSLVLSRLFGTMISSQQGVMSFKTKNGVYDCVDFYKQPTFNHPLLKNLSSKKLPNLADLQRRLPSDVRFKDDISCPKGTVPILRVNTNSNSIPITRDGSSNSSGIPSNEDLNCLGIVHTHGANRKFYGIDALVSVFRPKVEHSQWSSARLKLLNENNFLEAGWMVNPDVFDDYDAHLFTRFLTGGKTCINHLCPGFVQVAGSAPLGSIPTNYSQLGYPSLYWHLSIDKHHETDKDWWLYIGDDKLPIGYWPSELFTSLAESAYEVQWGGEVQTGPLPLTLPEMGAGKMVNYDPYRASTIARIKVNEDYHYAEPKDTKKIWNYEDLYNVKDAGHQRDLGRFMLYGGPWPAI